MQKIKPFFTLRWWNETLSFRTSAIFMAVLVPVVSVLAIPTQITVDGIFYVASAKALFSPDFAYYYIWYREPGYPLFLKAIHLLGNSALYVQAIQALCMGLAVWMLLYAFRRSLGHDNVTRLQIGLAIVFMFNPMYFTYSGNFLQQALFCLILATFAVFVEWSRKLPKNLSDVKLGLFALILYVMGILTSIGWLYLSLFPLLLIWANMVRRSVARRISSRPPRSRMLTWVLSVLSVIALLATSYGVGRATYAGWEAYKAPYAAQATYDTTVVAPLETVPTLHDPVYIATRFLALMDIGHIDQYEPQNEIFSEAAMRLRFVKSEYDTAYVNLPTTDYAPGYFALSDPSIIAHTIFAIFAPASQLAYKAMYALFALLALLLLWKRRWGALALALIPMSFIFIHAANNTPVDRYGIPGFTFAIALSAIFIGDLITTRALRKTNNV